MGDLVMFMFSCGVIWLSLNLLQQQQQQVLQQQQQLLQQQQQLLQQQQQQQLLQQQLAVNKSLDKHCLHADTWVQNVQGVGCRFCPGAAGAGGARVRREFRGHQWGRAGCRFLLRRPFGLKHWFLVVYDACSLRR